MVNNRFHPGPSSTWKATQSLAVNFGLGYDLETGLLSSNLPLPEHLAQMLNGQNGGVPSGAGKAAQPNKFNFVPMAGFARAVGSDKKT